MDVGLLRWNSKTTINVTNRDVAVLAAINRIQERTQAKTVNLKPISDNKYRVLIGEFHKGYVSIEQVN